MQQYKQLFPGHAIAYAVPDGFAEADRNLFYPDNFEDQIPSVEMFVLEEVTVINGFLIQCNKFLVEFSHHSNSIVGSKWKSVLRLRVLPKEHLDIAIWGVQDWADNYFHWVTEMLPRLWAVHKTNREVPVLLLEKVSILPFVKQAMEFFKIPFKVVPVGRGMTVGCLLACKVPHVGQFNQYLLSAFRSDVLSSYPSERIILPIRKLYISRSDARRRKIVNEEALWQTLQHHGFDKVELDGMNWPDQVRLFRESVLVVSNHGAGLSNIMFMPADGRVIELKSLYNDYWCFYSLARVCHLQYTYLLCDATSDNHRSADIHVDVQKLLSLIHIGQKQLP
jgi:capsular polysaccharide biosynthesis protein